MSYRHGRINITASYLNAKMLSCLYILLGRENNDLGLVLIQFQHCAVNPNTYVWNTSFN